MAKNDYAPILNQVMWIQVAISVIFVALRLYTRYWVVRNPGWDDIMMMINLVTLIGFVAATSHGTTYGLGKKMADIQRLGLDNSKAIMWEAIGQGICILGIAASKSAVALFLLRIVVKTWHIVLLWFCILSTTIFCIITTTLLFVQCRPTAFIWDHTIPGGSCWLTHFVDIALAMGAWSATMDFVLALLPWHVIISLNMRRKDKITIALGLSLGVFAGACSIVRTIELTSLSSMEEYVYKTSPMLLWSSSEVTLTVICACIPVLRPLYTRLRYGSQGEWSDHSYPLDPLSKKSKSRSGHAIEMYADDKLYLGPGAGDLQTTVKGGGKNTSEEAILHEYHEQHGSPASKVDAEGGLGQAREIIITTTVTSKGENV